MALALLACIFIGPSFGIIGKIYVPQEHGVCSLKGLIFLWLGFRDAILVPFPGLVLHVVVLGLGHFCTITHGS
jgi:hypothetical protein